MNQTQPDEFNPELLHHYFAESSEDGFETPIFSELQTVGEAYCDKVFHSAGGMKSIYKIRDLRTDRFVAMAEPNKADRLSDQEAEQFLREARITAALDHPNIVPIYDIGLNSSGEPFFTMKFMKGLSLDKILREKFKKNPYYSNVFDRAFFLEMFLKVCEAVAYAHSCGIIHLDIKPANIMVGDYGEVYICDWGLAKIMNSDSPEYKNIVPLNEAVLTDITLSGEVKGTPGFMAPEQIDRQLGKRSEQTDVYALGALLYAMLTFQRPLAELSPEQTMQQTRQGTVPPPKRLIKELPDSLDAICTKAMAVEKADRYHTVDELLGDLRAYQEGFVTEAEDASAFKIVYLLVKRNRWAALMILVVILTGSVVGGILGSVMMKNKMEAAQKIEFARMAAVELERKLEEERGKLFADSDRLTQMKSIRGAALKLHGGGQYVQHKGLSFRQGAIAFWFKPERSKSLYSNFFQIGEFRWHIDNGRREKPGGLVSAGGDTYISADEFGGSLWGKWHHFVIIIPKKGDIWFYIDGLPVKVDQKYSGRRGFSLGHWIDGSVPERSMIGSIDELSIWKIPLNKEQIIKTANHSLTTREKGLVAYYNFDEDSENKVSDKFHLDVIGDVTYEK